MSALNPGKKRSFGNDSWGWAPAVADLTIPKLTELAATGALNLSCFLRRDQDGLSASTDQVTLDAVLCEIEDFQVAGVTTYSMPDLMVIFDPQGATSTAGRKAWETLPDLGAGVMWRRQGVRNTTDLAVADKVDLIPGQLGIKIPTKTNNDPSGIYAFQTTFSITGAPQFQKAVVAGP